jgi:hypothetical protein
LDEGAGEFFLFPWRGCFARAKTHDHVFPANRLAGVKGDVLDDAVPLVEDCEHRHPLTHRSNSGLADSDWHRAV